MPILKFKKAPKYEKLRMALKRAKRSGSVVVADDSCGDIDNAQLELRPSVYEPSTNEQVQQNAGSFEESGSATATGDFELTIPFKQKFIIAMASNGLPIEIPVDT